MNWTPISKTYVFSTLFGDPVPVGVVNLRDGLFGFAYARSWLERDDAYALDPLNMPLGASVIHHTRLFGPLADALPDTWGQRVIMATHSQAPANPIEWLLASRGRGVGALAFSASRSKTLVPAKPPSLADLSRVLVAMADIQASRHIDDPELAHLVEYGSSVGGARPKTVVHDAGREWIAKLPRTDDTFDQVGAEAASLAMAREVGIEVPDFRVENVSGQKVLMVARFDRVGGSPTAHYLSGESALAMRKIRMDDFKGDYSYQGLAGILRKISGQSAEDTAQLFKRMIFNVAIANTDDHLKNHGFIFRPGAEWILAPAFDLLPHPGQTAEHAIGIGALGRASRLDNAMSRRGVFGLTEREARAMVDEVLNVTAVAPRYFDQHQVPETDRELLASLCRSNGTDPFLGPPLSP